MDCDHMEDNMNSEVDEIQQAPINMVVHENPLSQPTIEKNIALKENSNKNKTGVLNTTKSSHREKNSAGSKKKTEVGQSSEGANKENLATTKPNSATAETSFHILLRPPLKS